MALACTPPRDCRVPLTHWSHATLAFQLQRAGIVDSIGRETLRQWLSAMAIKPHRSRYWLNSQDPLFEAKMRPIVALYTDPPPDAMVVCFDERTGMQALERKHPTLPMQPGFIERREHEYVRHGTMDLMAALVVHTGEVIAACYERHTRYEVADFMAWMLRQLPRRKTIHLIMDNLRVHKTEEVQAVFRRYGERIQVHWTPLHASWLNQIEIFFSILVRRVLKRGHFTGQWDLADQVIRFVEWYRDHEAKPFRWNYTGKPLTA